MLFSGKESCLVGSNVDSGSGSNGSGSSSGSSEGGDRSEEQVWHMKTTTDVTTTTPFSSSASTALVAYDDSYAARASSAASSRYGPIQSIFVNFWGKEHRCLVLMTLSISKNEKTLKN